MNILFGNYGNHTIALVQWAYEFGLENVTVVNIHTGWHAEHWPARVLSGKALCARYGFQTQELEAPESFTELTLERGRLPTAKFQWCTTFLKAMPLLAWLDEIDPSCNAIIQLGARRQDSRARYDLPAEIDANDYYGGRCVKYPLVDHDNTNFKALIERSGQELLTTPSQECAPCIHSNPTNLSCQDQQRWRNLLKQIDATDTLVTPKNESLEQFDRGCGSHYACGE
ncbi:MAG: phosphoadenosine phosphosulfate reductase family protein [Pseudomonadota bacterium]|nr:phosphoadenosine phosphosulfate reductase family protein [Pseudomonadota bacterium]